MLTSPKLSEPVRITATRPPPPPLLSSVTGLPTKVVVPPFALIVPLPARLEVVSQMLPPAPPPLSLRSVSSPSARIEPLTVVVPPTVSFIAPPPSVCLVVVNLRPPEPILVGAVIDPYVG